MTYSFNDIARLASPEDNVAIASKRLELGTSIEFKQKVFTLSSTILEGHRFAIQPMSPGQKLLSWGLPFGMAIKEIQAGDYICNLSMLETLRGRSIEAQLPKEANFNDVIHPYTLEQVEPTRALPLYKEMKFFQGYNRGRRGVGTRNYIVLLGTSSLTSSYVKALEHKFKHHPGSGIDGIVAVAHTEGGTDSKPNNYDLVLRTLAGFVVHPNVAAVLCVDYGHEAVNNKVLNHYMQQHHYPLSEVIHHFISLEQDFAASLEQGEKIVREWLAPVSQIQRESVPLSALKIALQCGGSDAFSGISANPLLGWISKEILRYGGATNLAETDELIGAESYVLAKVKSKAVAQKFLDMVERFKTRVSWHGESAEGNPSGGNKLRGLYNIVLKSIGAAMKKDPQTRLDFVIDYAEAMSDGGFYFMDSPGNDLESIAGQVAAGCNMIFFTTGNGSITNFPFVPTIKVVTTSERFKRLEKDMDVNAGVYMEGISMDDLGRETLELTIQIASGQKSAGEKAGHAQVQLWRNWQQQDGFQLPTLLNKPVPNGQALAITKARDIPEFSYPAFVNYNQTSIQNLALILPTSLCSGQIANRITERLNALGIGRNQGLERFVSLAHTEGCGVSSGGEQKYKTAMLGYLRHPSVRYALLLEHGCEKTHNDYMRNAMQDLGISSERFGWASIQLDGGIEAVTQNVETWFREKIAGKPRQTQVGLEHLRLGLLSTSSLNGKTAKALANLSSVIVSAGGSVVVPETFADKNKTVTDELELPSVSPSLAYGQHVDTSGFHIMEAPTQDWLETLTGLGATGIDLVLAFTDTHPQQTHPMIPVLQVTDNLEIFTRYQTDLDAYLEGDVLGGMLEFLRATLNREQQPKMAYRNEGFQISRGLLGVSL
jgi:altronate dehydratase